MLTTKSQSLSLALTAALGGAMLLVTTAAMTAEAQSGRVTARGDRGAAVATRGADGGRFARGRGCTQAEGGQACGSGSSLAGPNGARAGRASGTMIGDDGSIDRDAGAYVLTEGGEATRLLDTQVNPDGSIQRSITGDADFATGFGARDSLLTVDENGNATRSGSAVAEGEMGMFATEGGGSYSVDGGLVYGRDSQLAAAGENGEVNARRSGAYDPETGLVLDRNAGGSVAGENGNAQGEVSSSYTRDGGYVLDGSVTAANAEGGTLDGRVTYNAEEGADANVTCTNAQGETVACRN